MIPIFKPFMPGGMISEIEEILYSGQLVSGKHLVNFENKLKQYIGAENVIATSSYNMAMLITLSSIGILPGDEIIASPVSCLASNQPFVTKQANVVWADVDPASGALDIEDVKRKITPKTKAIFHNHFCGYIGNIDELNTLAKEFGIIVVDDGIEAFGSEYKGNMIGNVGTDITVFSFQTVRLPNTIDGGAIVFKDKNLYEKACQIRDYGIDRSNFRNKMGEINSGSDIQLEGYAGVMNEVNAFIGFKQMEHIPDLLAKQRRNVIKWQVVIDESKSMKNMVITPDSNPNGWVYGLLAENKSEVLIKYRELGYYATGVHINNNVYSVFGDKNMLIGVNEFMSKFLALPSGWWVDNDQILK